MTSVVETLENEVSLPIYVAGARGYGILAVGPGDGGVDSLAVWKLAPTGFAEGAWIMSLDAMREDTEQLRLIMEMLRDKCLVDWTARRPLGIVDRIADLLPADLVTALRRNILVVSDLLVEINEQRTVFASAVDDYRKTTKSKITPLVWPSKVPAEADLADWAQRTAPSPVAASALSLTAAVSRAVQLWHDTEQTRYRRAYLHALGEPQALPSRWLGKLRAAAAAAEAR